MCGMGHNEFDLAVRLHMPHRLQYTPGRLHRDMLAANRPAVVVANALTSVMTSRTAATTVFL